MTRTRCPSCICEFDGITDREWVPSVKVIQSMILDNFITLMNDLWIIYDPHGAQDIVLWGNLDGICQRSRSAFVMKISANRVYIARILHALNTEEVGC